MTHHSHTAPQFFLTSPAPCPYLEGQYERKVFTHLVGSNAPMINDMLTQGGFRRSQNIAYRPACETCRACVSVRILVDRFEPTRSQKRVAKRNLDLVGTEYTAEPSSEQYALFRKYIDTRHQRGGMSEMSILDYAMMVEDSHVKTKVVEYRRRGPDTFLNGRGVGPLIAVALTDVMGDGLSMVYTFYDPDIADRSLGTWLILDHIARARALGLPHVYLGYWVAESPKMAYKANFRPQEHLTMRGWERKQD